MKLDFCLVKNINPYRGFNWFIWYIEGISGIIWKSRLPKYLGILSREFFQPHFSPFLKVNSSLGTINS
jgi:hypothetical protein